MSQNILSDEKQKAAEQSENSNEKPKLISCARKQRSKKNDIRNFCLWFYDDNNQEIIKNCCRSKIKELYYEKTGCEVSISFIKDVMTKKLFRIIDGKVYKLIQ